MHEKEDKDEELQSKKSQAARQEFIAYTVIITWTHLNDTIYGCSPKAIPPLQYWPNEFTFARLVVLCRRVWGLFNIFELLRCGKKTLKEQRNTMKGKLKTAIQSTKSYIGEEKSSNIFSNAIGQIFGRRPITCGQNSSFHHHYVACKQIFA